MKKQLLSVIVASFLLFSGFIPAAGQQTAPSDWAIAEVQAAVGAGFVPESLQSNYDLPITRAEFAELAVRFTMYELGYTPEEFSEVLALLTTPQTFHDTDSPYVVMANQMWVAYGDGNGYFRPDSSITREEAATMLDRVYDSYSQRYSYPPSPTFEDADTFSEWSWRGIRWCAASGVMRGISDTLFDPKGTYTREQSIVTFARMDALEDWKENNMQARIRRKITLEDAIAEYLADEKSSLLARYDTGDYGTVLYRSFPPIIPGSERYGFVLIGNDGKPHLLSRIPILNKWGQTPPATKIELLNFNSELYFEVRYEATMLGPDSHVPGPGTYWAKVNLLSLSQENGFIQDQQY